MVNKVCCIIYKKEYKDVKFLILHKNNWWNGWELIRGEVRPNELVEQTALREINHETGLNITKIRNLPFNYSYTYLKGLNFVNADVSCFIAEAKEENITLSNEHNYYKWVNLNQAMKLLEFEEQKKLLEHFYYQITH